MKPHWTRPRNYAGAEWPDHFRFLTRHRDSDCLTESNFTVALAALEAIPEPENWPHDEPPVQTVRESHWAVGWVEWIAIHQDASAALAEARRMAENLESYPVLSEDDFSERETAEANRIWRDCYDASERVAYVRQHRSQFDFHGFADLLACIRGKFFNGYASELIA